MSGGTPDEAHAAPSRGIEPEPPYTPPPPPDFGVAAMSQEPPPPYLAPPRTMSPWPIVAIVAAVVAVLALVIGLVVVGTNSLLSTTDDRDEAGPSLEIDDEGSSDATSVELSLQATIDKYKSARNSGTLWTTIDDTEYNRTAVSAFLYLLIDLKLAASFGADTSEYLARADEPEQKLLNEEPLGSDISIKLSDRTFTYDGDTGEGGYTDN